ncbi:MULTISPECIES: DUF680 domain-containing protein [unclassified Mesorhizobium]|uniref:DUF680 domain-containing protein n=1 Tax=unclassified Mesorhizobium TaxID=325217 RepID=UPI000FCCB247|nr:MULTISPECIES: DUF680 domain-containing protein [unclassified Mesorhizobium]RUZ58607.1 DUF680 domain-containing protein [Mesorhizobium sp. M7A.F.Ca.US.003.02.2.1]RUZ00909.1 DUF680 domain-containing protein [Mesorhizobium sp. M7A.F.Ca.CA.001.12.2.1]RUZ19470.1 DUF680 domain-containing protein [Mesorhizobium sp. M7A.F.Ca.US.007.01.2.1]RUZ49814.1 DUF680 domain-containing protein [Mesorhizobium sp. M7A.F.Ca.US.003.02.1.1]RUZ57484.1 DUF680 domain-containing protein [Mesorhizobium sp. M7A.F.Ca.US.0
MNRIALTAAAILVATGAAFAGSDNYGSDNVNQPVVTSHAVNVDHSYTASTHRQVKHRDLTLMPDSVQPESGQGNWGN